MIFRREASILRRARGATCQLWSSTPSQRHVSLSAGAPALSVSGEEAQHASLLKRARRGALVVLETRSVEVRRAGKRHISFGVWPWCDVPAAASSAKPAPRVTQRRRACALCLWGGGAALELITRTRRAAAVVVVSHSVESRDVSKRRHFFDARPLCEVSAAVFSAKPAPRVTQRRRIRTL